jgi:hypothetical protein
MIRDPVRNSASFFCAAAVFLLAGVSFAADEISKAEVLLFQTNHLKSIGEPARLVYRFDKQGELEEAFQDQVEIIVSARDGKKSVSTQYLNGKNKTDFPPVEDAEGNPVLLYFLERDIREMQRLTGGHWIFFQRRIRLALAESAVVRPVTLSYNGREVKGEEIRITPYSGDTLRSKFEKFADKYYVFTLSEGVPGGVYEIRAVVPGEKKTPESKPLVEERLTLGK